MSHFRESDGIRTRDSQCHKLVLYQLSYRLHVFRDEGGTRTHNQLLRKQLLYPVELPHHCGSRRIRTFGTNRFNTLAVCRFRPLSHTSFPFDNTKVEGANAAFFRSRIFFDFFEKNQKHPIINHQQQTPMSRKM